MKGFKPSPEYLAAHPEVAEKLKTGTRGKYGNARTDYNGVSYHSRLEAMCAATLDNMQRMGLVTRWQRQVPFDLGAGITYRADFVVHYAKGQPRTIDAKGYETSDFKLKRKLFESQYGPLDIVKHERNMPQEGR